MGMPSMIYIWMFCLDKEFARVAIQGDFKIVIATMYHLYP